MKTENAFYHLTRDSVIAQNTIFNLIGRGIPLVAALFSMPLLISGLGTERFGILAIAWMFIGYFNLFDFGIGLALTKLVAEKLGSRREAEISSISWTSLLLIAILGIFGGLIFALISPWVVYNLLKIPTWLQPETLKTFYLLACTIPFVISTSALRGLLIAYQRFGFINVFRSTLGILTYISPLFILPFYKNLVPVVSVLALLRLLTWLSYLLFCLKTVPGLRTSLKVKKKFIRPLLGFGSWIALNNIIDPFLVYFDRFMIGALLSMTAVAYYVTPYEVVTKLLIISGSLSMVLFPAFATTFCQNTHRTVDLYDKSIRFIFLILFPVILITISLSQQALSLWLGNDFAINSFNVLQWLAFAVFLNSFAYIPSILLQSLGRPDIPTKLHIIELPIYLIILWVMIHILNITGASIAWTIRVFLDMLILFIFAKKKLPDSVLLAQKKILIFSISLLVLLIAMIPFTITGKIVFLILVFNAYFLIAWFMILLPKERNYLLNKMKNISLKLRFI